MLHETLWRQNEDLAGACLAEPFVRELGQGTLAEEIFRDYVAQDAFFLDAFRRAYALSLARSPDEATVAAFHKLIGGVQQELELHSAYAEELKIDLTAVEPNPACRAYTDFLLATAWHRTLGEILAAMTPCMKLYAYLGACLYEQIGGEGGVKSHRYGRWIATYADSEVQELAGFVDSLLDQHAEDTPAVREAYRYAMACERDFFSDAYHMGRAADGGER